MGAGQECLLGALECLLGALPSLAGAPGASEGNIRSLRVDSSIQVSGAEAPPSIQVSRAEAPPSLAGAPLHSLAGAGALPSLARLQGSLGVATLGVALSGPPWFCPPQTVALGLAIPPSRTLAEELGLCLPGGRVAT